MRLEFDLNVGALYIALTSLPVASTREVGDNANVDLDDRGAVVGIEVISAAHPWPLSRILTDFDLSEPDKAQLIAYFMPASQPAIAPQEHLPVPVLEAEPTAPSSILAAA